MAYTHNPRETSTPTPKTNLLRLPNNFIHRLRKILHVFRIQPSHTDPPILRHVHMTLLPQLSHLHRIQSRETEHANLLGDMLPTTRRAQFLEFRPECGAHVLDAPAHSAQVGFPFGEQGVVVQDQRGHPGAVGGGVADLAALKDGKLRSDASDGVGCVGAGSRHEMKSAGALAVQAEVLGERLGDAHFEAALDEVTDGPGVVFQVAGCEALVGAVEEGEVGFLTDEVGERGPLVTGGVDAGGVMGAGVQEDDAAGGSSVDGGEHAVEVEAFGLRGEVRVGGDGKVDVGEDLVVVGPGWGGEVDCLVRWAGVEFGEEEAAQVDGAGAGDGL